mmetsp:Transcript_62038/g.146937  ORF Transcript_62038/g.146937 Transcript_62038/m.146937 type:complete len:261 (-) Transcript_62038:128-910(-)
MPTGRASSPPRPPMRPGCSPSRPMAASPLARSPGARGTGWCSAARRPDCRRRCAKPSRARSGCACRCARASAASTSATASRSRCSRPGGSRATPAGPDYSARASRLISRSTASRARRRPSSRATIASVIGISTPAARARASTVGALYTPSATWPSWVRICGRPSPWASSRPTRRLRDRSPVAVSTRSPKPDRPMKVSALAPRARPSRSISARPRVINAARAFRPGASGAAALRPSQTPTAIAITFLTAPPTSTPTGSLDV